MAEARRRETVNLTLPPEVIRGLRALAQGNFRTMSREAELAIVHRLAEEKVGALK
jgi:hypothetical protein